MGLGAAQFYEEKVERFDVPSFAQSFAAIQSWRVHLLDRRVAELSRGAAERMRLRTVFEPDISVSSGVRFCRVGTHWGTMVFADQSDGMLRHGPKETSPTNVVMSDHDGIAYLHRVVPDGSRYPIRVMPAEVAADDLRLSQSAGWGREFRFMPLPDDGGARFALESGGLLLCAEGDGRVTLSRRILGPWEVFRFLEDTVSPAVEATGET